MALHFCYMQDGFASKLLYMEVVLILRDLWCTTQCSQAPTNDVQHVACN